MKKTGLLISMFIIFIKLISNTAVSQYSYYNKSYSSSYNWTLFIILGIYAAIFIVYILIAIWVYKDAKKRGENASLWAVIVVFAGLIGILIWFAIRPPIGGKKTISDRRCPNCGRGIPFDANICPYCGKRFESFL